VLTICYELSNSGQKTDVVTLFFTGFKRLWIFLRPDSFGLFLVVFVTAAFFNLPFASSLVSMTAFYDYLGIFLKSNHQIYIAAIIIFAAIFYLISFSLFSIHYLIIENRKFTNALKASRNLVRGESIRNALRFGIWFLLVFIVLAAVYTILLLAAAYTIKVIWPPDTQVTAFLSGARVITQLMTLLLYAIFTPLAFLMVSSLFYALKERHNEPLVSIIHQDSDRKMKRRLDLLLVVILIVSIVLNFSSIDLSLHSGILNNIELVRTPKITAHRGSSLEAPENTLSAIEAAANDMADYAEIDVRATKDGVVVLLHDPSLKRTTGLDKNIWDLTYEETQSLDAGSWLSDKFIGEKIPTLDEIIKYADGKIMLNIEIKTSDYSPELTDSVVKIIQDNHFEKQCVISTYNYGVLKGIKTLDPDIRTGIIITVAFANYTHLSNVDFYSLNAQFITREKVDKLHFLGFEVYAWGVYSAVSAKRMTDLGVDNLIASDPLIAKEIVYTSSANLIVLKITELVFGKTDLKQTSIQNVFLPYW